MWLSKRVATVPRVLKRSDNLRKNPQVEQRFTQFAAVMRTDNCSVSPFV